jgi:hypothetical protein
MHDSSMLSTHDTVRMRSSKCALSPSHGENRGSSPLGSASGINNLAASTSLAGISYGISTAKAAREAGVLAWTDLTRTWLVGASSSETSFRRRRSSRARRRDASLITSSACLAFPPAKKSCSLPRPGHHLPGRRCPQFPASDVDGRPAAIAMETAGGRFRPGGRVNVPHQSRRCRRTGQRVRPLTVSIVGRLA